MRSRRRSSIKLPARHLAAGAGSVHRPSTRTPASTAEAHDVDSGSMFYYFRPLISSCKLAAADVDAATATLSPSASTTTGKFPEYTKIWEDNTLNVVAIFGKYEDGATSGDAGIDGFNEFVASMKTELASHNLTTIPASVPTDPGVACTRHRVQRDARRWQEDPRRRAAHRQRRHRPVAAGVPQPLRVAVDPRRLHRLQRSRRTRLEHSRARVGGQVGRRPVRRRVHERLRHVRVHRWLAVGGAQVDQPRRHHRLEVHRHRQQRHAGVLRVDVGRRDGDVPRLPRLRFAADLRADLRARRRLRRW